jgi:MoxR-like ATPase
MSRVTTSWFFTANDDAGGGTFPVIQALRDRMDVTVAALGFNNRFFDELVARVEAGDRPEDHVPSELVFGSDARHAMAAAIRAVPVPADVRRQLEFFSSHFEFVQHGGRRFEYRTKDTVATAGASVSESIGSNSGADLEADLGSQSVNSISVRALQSLITYAKAMAWFRGEQAVTIRDVSAVLPFVLRGKLLPNTEHPRFDSAVDHELLTDSIAWLGELFDESVRQFGALGLGEKDAVGLLLAEVAEGLDGLSAVDVSRRITTVESTISNFSRSGKLYGRDYDDLLALKYLHQRYTNYQRWLAAQ